MERPTVVVELAENPQFAKDLSAGGVFVAGCTLPITQECELLVKGPSGVLAIPARVVYVDPAKGAGLELVGFGPTIKERLDAIAERDEEVEPLTAQREPSGDGDGEEGEPATIQDGAPSETGDDDGIERDVDGNVVKKETLQDRLRGLSLAEQVRKANSADPTTRITLERLYGKNVWEALLRNPRLTAPEVARLARMGTLPRVQLETIVNNGAWMQMPEVRRALLTNPRLGTDQIMRVLRLMPKHELKVAASTMAYTFAVRDAAKKMIRDD